MQQCSIIPIIVGVASTGTDRCGAVPPPSTVYVSVFSNPIVSSCMARILACTPHSGGPTSSLRDRRHTTRRTPPAATATTTTTIRTHGTSLPSSDWSLPALLPGLSRDTDCGSPSDGGDPAGVDRLSVVVVVPPACAAAAATPPSSSAVATTPTTAARRRAVT